MKYQTTGHIRGLATFYNDGTERLEIHVPKSKSQDLPFKEGEAVEIRLIINNDKYNALLRATKKNNYVWVSPKIQTQSGEHETLAKVLKEDGFLKNQKIILSFENKTISLKKIKDVGTVTSWEEIKNNIITLENYRNAELIEREYLLNLIKNGTCFVAYVHENQVHFAPSRFIGYLNNTISKHQDNVSKDGRVTNKAISDILKEPPIVDGELEFQYKKFCQSLGFTPLEKGSFGVTRKFWFSPEYSDVLSKIKDSSTSVKNEPVEKKDSDLAIKALREQGEETSVEGILNQIEKLFAKDGRILKSNWRIITERNIKEYWYK